MKEIDPLRCPLFLHRRSHDHHGGPFALRTVG